MYTSAIVHGFRNNARMDLTREKFVEALNEGVRVYGTQTEFQRAAGLRKYYIKDALAIRASSGKPNTYLPSAEDWAGIKAALGWSDERLLDRDALKEIFRLLAIAEAQNKMTLAREDSLEIAFILYDEMLEFKKADPQYKPNIKDALAAIAKYKKPEKRDASNYVIDYDALKKNIESQTEGTEITDQQRDVIFENIKNILATMKPQGKAAEESPALNITKRKL